MGKQGFWWDYGWHIMAFIIIPILLSAIALAVAIAVQRVRKKRQTESLSCEQKTAECLSVALKIRTWLETIMIIVFAVGLIAITLLYYFES